MTASEDPKPADREGLEQRARVHLDAVEHKKVAYTRGAVLSAMLSFAREEIAAAIPPEAERVEIPLTLPCERNEGFPVLPAGMVPWHGGDSAPADWDGEGVMLRNGSMMFPGQVSLAFHANGTNRWNHAREYRNPDWDIIAYTPRDPATPAEQPDQRAGEVDTPLGLFACIVGERLPDTADHIRARRGDTEMLADIERAMQEWAALHPSQESHGVEGGAA